jgi:hypothetical protein
MYLKPQVNSLRYFVAECVNLLRPLRHFFYFLRSCYSLIERLVIHDEQLVYMLLSVGAGG